MEEQTLIRLFNQGVVAEEFFRGIEFGDGFIIIHTENPDVMVMIGSQKED